MTCKTSAFGILVFSAIVKNAVLTDGINNEIVQDSVTLEAKYPYQASLRHVESRKHFCSGSVIRPNWILTVAHCVYNNKTSSMYVIVGAQTLRSKGYEFFVSNIIVHENFNTTNFAHDIALLQLAGSIVYNNRVRPISLARFSIPGGINCSLTGWDLTTTTDLSSDLQHVSLKTLSISQCRNALPEYPVLKSHVCAYATDEYNTCRGDSGGPLVFDGFQIGIASWGITCVDNSPYVFTSVTVYKRWIENHTLS